ncbi:hypothetical protein [Daejeonella sp.]|jgi:hypothetical protein|uniref:hypothetical protein n=1 Tax=Daejeonella sp. TaxID=2805397 RepID=UPI0037C05B68
MKILVLFLLIPVGIFAQEIPKGATKIIINNELSAKDNFDLVVKTLLDNDYFIDAKDAELFTVKTQPKKVNKWTGLYFLNIRTMDKEIQVSGMFKTGIDMTLSGFRSTEEYDTVTYKGMKGSLFILAFENMDNFASKLNSNKIYK